MTEPVDIHKYLAVLAPDFGYEPPWEWNSAARYGKARLAARERAA